RIVRGCHTLLVLHTVLLHRLSVARIPPPGVPRAPAATARVPPVAGVGRGPRRSRVMRGAVIGSRGRRGVETAVHIVPKIQIAVVILVNFGFGGGLAGARPTGATAVFVLGAPGLGFRLERFELFER